MTSRIALAIASVVLAAPCLIQAQAVDPDTIPEAAVANAPALGKVAARNLGEGFLITTVAESKTIRLGTQLAVRRDNVIVATGYIESFQDGKVSIVALHNPAALLQKAAVLQPMLGDAVILYPPPRE